MKLSQYRGRAAFLLAAVLLIALLAAVWAGQNTPEAKFERNLKTVLTAYFTFPWDLSGLEAEEGTRPYTRAYMERACGGLLTESGFRSLEREATISTAGMLVGTGYHTAVRSMTLTPPQDLRGQLDFTVVLFWGPDEGPGETGELTLTGRAQMDPEREGLVSHVKLTLPESRDALIALKTRLWVDPAPPGGSPQG